MPEHVTPAQHAACQALLDAAGLRPVTTDLDGVRALYARFARDRERLSAVVLGESEPLPSVALPKPTPEAP